MLQRALQVRSKLAGKCWGGLLPQTPRLQRVPSAWGESMTQVFALRDDDTGALSNGGKRRKHASLLHALEKHGCTDAIILAGRNSFNAAAIGPVLVERGVRPWLVEPLPGPAYEPSRLTLMSLATLAVFPEAQRVAVEWDGLAVPWAPSFKAVAHAADDWAFEGGQLSTQAKAALAIARKLSSQGRVPVVVPEGACCTEAVAGAATLGADIAISIAREAAQAELPVTVVLDAGTGLSAAAAVAGLEACLGNDTQWVTPTSVVDLTGIGARGQWNDLLRLARRAVFAALDMHPQRELEYSLVVPTTARSFGAVNSTLRKELLRAASLAGLVVDPVYGAKLLHVVRHQVLPGMHYGSVVAVLSGGAHGLGGWAQWASKGLGASGNV